MSTDGLKCVERYRLILRHEYITDKGDTIRLEDPIVVQMIIVPEASHRYSEPVIVEKMVDSLKSFLLDEIDRDRNPRWTQPTAQPEPHWIPCSERLPEVNGRYLVTRGLNACGSLWNRVYIANYSDLMGLKSERIWWNGNVGKSDFERIDDVIAWMPLPSPYEP